MRNSILKAALIVIATTFLMNLGYAQSWTVYDDSNTNIYYPIITSIAIDSNNIKWIGTPYGLYNLDDTAWTSFNIANSDLPSENISALAIDHNNNVWMGFTLYQSPPGNGVAMFDGSDWYIYNTSNSDLPSNVISTIEIDQFNNIWVGTHEGLAKFDGTNWTVYTTSNSELPNNRIWAITFDLDGSAYISTGASFFSKFDGDNWTHYSQGLPSSIVTSMDIDSSNNLWFATFGEGIGMFNGTSATIYDTTNSELLEDYALFITVDEEDTKWIGLYSYFSSAVRGGVARLNDNGWESFTSSNSELPHNRVYVIIPGPNNEKWIGTHEGVAVYKESTVGVRDYVENDKDVLIYPNPSSGFLNIELPFSFSDYSAEFITSDGLLVKSIKLDTGHNTIDTSDLPTGTYVLKIKNEDFVYTKKWIKI